MFWFFRGGEIIFAMGQTKVSRVSAFRGVQSASISCTVVIYCRLFTIAHPLPVGIIDRSTNTSSPASNPFDSKSSQPNSRRSIIVEEDLKATQRNNDRGSGGGGGCC